MTPWKSGDPVLARRLNEMQEQPLRQREARAHGMIVHFGKVIAATATGINDANANPVQWTYEIHEVEKTATGYTSTTETKWSVLDSGIGFRTTSGYSMAEDGNTTAGRQRDGVDHDGTDYPPGFQMQPLQVGSIVPFVLFIVPSPSTGVYAEEAWILPWPNGEDGTCT